MNIRLGIYEVFSRIVPGGLYVAAIVQFLSILGIVDINLQVVNDLSLVVLIGFVVIAYILGGAFDNLALLLFGLFKGPNLSGRTFAKFKDKYQGRWQIDFEKYDFPVLLAFIRTKNLELAGELDRHSALSIMLRNVSLGLLFMAVNSSIQFFISGNSINIFASIVLLVVSVLIIREAVKFRVWFYEGIFETILAYRIDLEAAIKPVRPGKTGKGSTVARE